MPPTERWDDASATVLPPPHAVALRAEQRLAETPHRAALRDVRCAFRSGVLVLRGQVPSYFLKQVAQSAVTGLEGVQRVVNRIDVTTA